MVQLIKKNIKLKNHIFLNSFIGNFQFFFIDKKFIIPISIIIKYHNDILFFQTKLGTLTLPVMKKSIFFFQKNTLLITINFRKNKKSILHLYEKLIRLKIKGLLQGFKTSLHLKGIGFRSLIKDNILILKLGFSHSISLPIPSQIKITSHGNLLIFSSIDANLLFQFVHFVKNYKTPEPYKGKGLLLKNEKIVYKAGKKSKK